MAGYRNRSEDSGERRFSKFNGRSRGRFGDSEGSSRFGDRERRPMEMHSAVCDSCGQKCEVPFRPTGSKPVLCRDCFKKGGRSSDSRSLPPVSHVELDQINDKLDKIIRFLKIE